MKMLREFIILTTMTASLAAPAMPLPELRATKLFVDSAVHLEDASAADREAVLFDQTLHPKFLEEFGPFSREKLNVDLVVESIVRADGAVAVTDDGAPTLKNTLYFDYRSIGTPSFSILAFHELQHLYNFRLGQQGRQRDETWLNEGLSIYVAGALAEEAPTRDLAVFAQSGETCGIGPQSACSGAEQRAQDFLFYQYLDKHFGRETVRHLIYDPTRGLEKLRVNLPSLEAAVLNFSAALVLNQQGISPHDELALGQPNYTMRPQILAQPSIGFVLAPYQAKVFEIPYRGSCYAIATDPHVQAYIVTPSSTTQAIRPAAAKECFEIPAETAVSVMIVNLNAAPSKASLALQP